MVIKKVGKEWGVYHCHGKLKGKLIHKFPTYKKALAQHTAIILSQQKRKR
jgi:hypothetical protein